jgi:hypothetical protein
MNRSRQNDLYAEGDAGRVRWKQLNLLLNGQVFDNEGKTDGTTQRDAGIVIGQLELQTVRVTYFEGLPR